MKMNIISLKKPWLKAAIVLLAIGSLSSCLKNTGPVEDFGQSPALVGFQYIGSQAAPFIEAILPNPDDTIAMEVTLSVAALTLSSPVTVHLAVDQPTLDLYNADTTTSSFPTVYTMLPSDQYTLTGIASDGTVTINPGQQIVSVTIHVAGDQVDFTKDNALAFKLTDAKGATIATNLSGVVFLFTLKNIYDGHYTIDASSTLVDGFNPALTGKYPLDVDLVTLGKYSVGMYDIARGGFVHTILNGTSISYYGGFGVQFNFDPTGNGNVISVVNYYGQGNNNRAGQLVATGINTFDFATRTLSVTYLMLQGGAPRTTFTEVYDYVGPR
jgi:hypothetical protein